MSGEQSVQVGDVPHVQSKRNECRPHMAAGYDEMPPYGQGHGDKPHRNPPINPASSPRTE